MSTGSIKWTRDGRGIIGTISGSGVSVGVKLRASTETKYICMFSDEERTRLLAMERTAVKARGTAEAYLQKKHKELVKERERADERARELEEAFSDVLA